ncbi:MAG TPA: c-type cytochrome [Burkholderiales bacterium]|nr:c-type cytochrome [Burkholderiales bacterium]
MKDEGPDHAHSSPIKTPKQLIIVIVLAFVIPIIGIILLVKFASTGNPPSEEVLNPESTAQRIAPVAKVMTVDSPGAAEEAAASGLPTMAAASPAAGGAAAGDKGQGTYQSACAACHGAGVLGAPKMGDKGQWAPRIAKGKDTLYTHAIKGFGAMPPKGGAMSLADADVKAAVDYMVNASK